MNSLLHQLAKKLNASSMSKSIISRSLQSQAPRRRQRQQQNTPTSNQYRMEKMKIKEGLSISQTQIERLWNLYDVNNEDGSPQEFEVKTFASKYPNVNKALSAKTSLDPQPDLSLSTDASPNSFDIEEVSEEIFNPIAQEAELKLQRMLSKIDNHDALQFKIPSDVQRNIRMLLTEELETVLDLWLRISQTDECQTLQQAVTATDRAMDLLLQFQSLNERGIKIAAPIHCYQAVLHNYFELFTINETTLGVNDLIHFQKRGRGLLKGMIKQVITARINALNGNEALTTLNYERPLHDSYNAVLSMHTSDQILKQPMKASSSKNEIQAVATDMVNGSSKLLQEMELYYHDFHTNQLPIEHQSLQDFLVSIHPQKESFQKTIGGFVRVAEEYRCMYSIQRAVDVLERCWKRYLAYEKNGEDNMEQVFKPDVELYEMVLRAYEKMGGNMNLDKVENLIIDVDDGNLLSILREIQKKREI
jgi:hypothetical protein